MGLCRTFKIRDRTRRRTNRTVDKGGKIIPDERYADIATKLALCQAQEKPCMLVWIESGYDDDGDQCDAISWRTATHSVYETHGMVSRCLIELSPVPSYNIDKTEEK